MNCRFQQGKLGLFALHLKTTVRFAKSALKTTVQERGRRSGLPPNKTGSKEAAS
jgi:hypothetical protein